MYDYLIVGGGLAAVSALDGIRSVDPAGSVLILTEEAEPPYQRPPLSKEYLRYPEATRDLLHIKPEGWFDTQPGVRLERRQRALVLEPASLRITTTRGNEYEGRRILLACGGRPRTLELPGSKLEGVVSFRTVNDADRLRELMTGGGLGRVVLVGAGFIGMELAAALRIRGVEVVVVEAQRRVWPHALPPPLAAWVQEHCESRGVTFRLGASVQGFRGEERVESVLLEGDELPCDLAIIGVGMVPNDEIARDAGLAVSDGILVDEYGETSHPWIFAAGDVARFPDPVFGGRSRIEHWEHARDHGQLVGRNMAGENKPYTRLSHCWSEAFEIRLLAVGRPADSVRTIMRGTAGEGPCIAFGERDGRLHSAVLVDTPGELEACRELVGQRTEVAGIEERLRDAAAPLSMPG